MLASLLLAPALHARSLDTDKDDVVSFIAEMHDKHGLDPELVRTTLAQAEIKQGILDAISKPAERALKWFEYRPIFVTEKRISQGHEFWDTNHDLVTRIGEEYGVAPQVLVAIVGGVIFGFTLGTWFSVAMVGLAGGAARQRAEDWSLGDIDALRSTNALAQQETCWSALMQSPKVATIRRQFDEQWLQLVYDSLENHSISLAVVPITELFKKNGVLDLLRSRGYLVEEP